MKNLRKIFALLIVTALTFNVSACAGGSSNDSINTSSTPEQSETVSIGDSSETTDNSNQEDFPGEPPEGDPGAGKQDKRMNKIIKIALIASLIALFGCSAEGNPTSGTMPRRKIFTSPKSANC